MHELSIVESIVKTADSFAREHKIEHVRFLTIQIGVLTGVIPQYVSMYYSDLAEGTALEGSELKIEEVEAAAFCRSCGELFDPTETERCPVCRKDNYDVLHGKELSIKDMGFAEDS